MRDLQPQFAAYLGTPTRARGYPPFAGQHALIVEVAPALAIERVTDLALRAVPAVEPGILFVERQFGVLEVHGRDLDDVRRAGQAILDGLGADEKDQLRPRILFSDVIEDVTDAHAIIINRNRSGSMIIPGDTLGVSEVTPALFAAVAANEAERAAPGVTLVDVSMIGAAGRIYLSGPAAEVRRAQREITEVLRGRGRPGPRGVAMGEHDLSAGGDVMDRVRGCAQDALAAYGGVSPAASVELLNVSENATFLVTDPDAGPSVLRVHRLGYHTEQEIASELAWMDALRAEAGVRTPRVLPAADGRRVVTVPERGGTRRNGTASGSSSSPAPSRAVRRTIPR